MGVEAALQDTNKHLEEVVKLLKGLVAEMKKKKRSPEQDTVLQPPRIRERRESGDLSVYHGEGSGGF
jgi:hypothetical protein